MFQGWLKLHWKIANIVTPIHIVSESKSNFNDCKITPQKSSHAFISTQWGFLSHQTSSSLFWNLSQKKTSEVAERRSATAFMVKVCRYSQARPKATASAKAGVPASAVRRFDQGEKEATTELHVENRNIRMFRHICLFLGVKNKVTKYQGNKKHTDVATFAVLVSTCREPRLELVGDVAEGAAWLKRSHWALSGGCFHSFH